MKGRLKDLEIPECEPFKYDKLNRGCSAQNLTGLVSQLNGGCVMAINGDIFKTARSSMISYGAQMTFDKWNYSDTQAVRMLVRYSFNTTMSKYKGKGAGLSESRRL